MPKSIVTFFRGFWARSARMDRNLSASAFRTGVQTTSCLILPAILVFSASSISNAALVGRGARRYRLGIGLRE